MKHRSIFATSLLFAAAGTAYAGPDEAAVIGLLEAQSKAESAFPRTLDIPSVVKIYAADSTNFNNGKLESLEETKSALAELEEMVNLGNQLGISSRRVNISAKAIGPGYVFATYDFSAKIANAGQVIAEEVGKCTTLFKKNSTSWQIQHEHCSTLPQVSDASAIEAEAAPATQ